MRHPVSVPARFRLGALGMAQPGAKLILAACFVAALATTTLAAQTVTLQASSDTTLKEGSPNRSFGSEPTLILKEGGSRVLIQFNPAAITAAVGGGSLASAQLQVYVDANSGNWGSTGRTVDIYQLATAWTEAGATWNCADDPSPGHTGAGCTSPWSGGTPVQGANGASGDGEATDTAVITNGTSGWVQFDVTSDVAAFLAGTANDGWLIQKTDEGQTGRIDLVSREGTAGLGPRLVLVSQSATSDTVPPVLAIAAPSQPVLVNVLSPSIGLTYQDAGSGVDTSTLRVLLDGQDLTAGCTIAAQAATCSPPPLAAGTHTITASLSDHAGNVATATSSFQLLLGPGISTVTLPVSADTFITAKSPDREHGRAATLRVAKSGPSRALVEFDAASLTAAVGGNQVLAAQLQLGIAANAKNWGSAGRTLGVYRLTTAWSEAAATWDCPADTNLDNAVPDCAAPWNGSSFVAAPTATALITRQTTGSVSLDVTADVSAFLAGTADDGWLVAKTDEALAGRIDFVSREASSGHAAQLIVEIQVPAPLPTVAITSPLDGSYSRNAIVQVIGQAGGSAIGVTINGQAATLGQGGAFTAQVTLSPGGNTIVAVASDAAGNQATATIGVILDTKPPTVTLTSPLPGAITNQTQITVSGTALDDYGVASLTVAGQMVALASDQFSTTVQLAAGTSSIAVTATDLAGNTQTVSVTVTQFSVPVVSILAPPDLSYVNATTATVSGTATGATSISVNGVAAALAGTSFSATGVPLIEGGNTLTATATDAQGHVGIASINVVRDLTPPHVAIYTPAAGATIAGSSVTVSGLVNDIVAGTVNASNATVTVNGIPATVANRSFIVPNVPLQPGNNVLTAVAVDAAGNQAQTTVTVRQMTPAGPRIAVAAGDGQSASINTLLPQQLVAVLLDGSGQPVAGQQVLFQAVATDGTFDNGRRSYAVTSDVSGQATVHFMVGSHAGAGNQVVKASAPGFFGPAQFVASAQPGGPALLVVDSGDQQQGVAGQALPLPLVAVVVDAGGNRLTGVAATLSVVKGAGVFANGQQALSLTSDSDGRLIASFTTDPAEGVANNIVQATIDALPGGPVVSFVASTLAASDPALTAISGVVLDNSNQPVAGATLRILGTALTAESDAQGQFQLSAVPAGTLQLIVDGSTVQRPGSWPQLELNLTPVPGRNNTLRMPVYLLPLDLENGIVVDETHGGTLTLPQLPGFALKILPGSVTFPGGGRSGTVSVTVVHSDKVPMVPNFGQQPRLIVTIQPAGAQFNPPAIISLPNVEGRPAGSVTEFYSFDHDLGHFVSIGPGTVSDDGTVITSNVGVGIVKAGWHCCGSPQGSGSPNDCPDCQDCSGPQCVNRTLCKPCNNSPGEACDGAGSCRTGKQLIPELCNNPDQKISVGVGDSVNQGCLPGECGAHLHVDYVRITSTCNSVDLSGAELSERVVVSSQQRCTGQTGNTKARCTALVRGILSLCHDDYYLCIPTSEVPVPFSCTQTNTQTLIIDTCQAETHQIHFSILRTADGLCSGTVTRD
jgi:hypothetical protein